MTRKRAERFPLWLHPSGQYCKKFRGKNFYFGASKEEALKRFLAEWDDIQNGRAARRNDSITVKDLCNHFLNAKRARVDIGELSLRTWGEYHSACEIITDTFGKLRPVPELRPSDFGKLRSVLAERFGPRSLTKYITLTKTLFKWGFESELLLTPPRYGNQFAKPPKRVLRLERARKAPKLLPAADVRKLIDAADAQLKAMILLGINCGFGAKDCADMQRSALIRPGWVNYPRPKTGIARRCPLWPETVAALDAVAKRRPDAKSEADANCVFITKYGHRWVRLVDKGEKRALALDAVALEFRKLKKRTGVETASGPYILRHIFQTIADETKDNAAVGTIMGHSDNSMASYYRELVEDSRLEAVVDHVHAWLFKEAK